MSWHKVKSSSVCLKVSILHTLIIYIFGLNSCCLIIVFAVEQIQSLVYAN